MDRPDQDDQSGIGEKLASDTLAQVWAWSSVEAAPVAAPETAPEDDAA